MWCLSPCALGAYSLFLCQIPSTLYSYEYLENSLYAWPAPMLHNFFALLSLSLFLLHGDPFAPFAPPVNWTSPMADPVGSPSTCCEIPGLLRCPHLAWLATVNPLTPLKGSNFSLFHRPEIAFYCRFVFHFFPFSKTKALRSSSIAL